MDIFRIFDCLNYIKNSKLGVDSVGSAGGFVESNLYYIGGVLDHNKGKYDLGHYINLTKDLSGMGVFSLAVMDMTGLLTPRAATMLILVLSEELPRIPLHITFPRSYCSPRTWEACTNSWYLRICPWMAYPIGPRSWRFQRACSNT